jgi:hypothetical protein
MITGLPTLHPFHANYGHGLQIFIQFYLLFKGTGY